MKLTVDYLRKIIKEELEKLPSYAYYGYGIDDIPDKTDAHEDIIGHTWMTHVKKKGSSLNEVGEVIWHSLDKNGNTNKNIHNKIKSNVSLTYTIGIIVFTILITMYIGYKSKKIIDNKTKKNVSKN